MPEIDDFVVRLDADPRPLDRSLRQAMAHLERFSEKAERELRPVFEQLDAIVERSGLPEAQAAFSRATEANAAALTAQLDAFSRQVALQLGPLLGQVLIGLSTSVGGSAIYDRLRRGDQGLLKRIVPEDADKLQPDVAAQTALEFETAARLKEFRAKDALAPDRFVLEEQAKALRSFSESIRTELENHAASFASNLSGFATQQTNRTLFRGEDSGSASLEEFKKLADPLLRFAEAMQNREAFDPEPLQQALDRLLEAVKENKTIEPFKEGLVPLFRILESIEDIQNKAISPDLRRRLDLMRRVFPGGAGGPPSGEVPFTRASFGGAASHPLLQDASLGLTEGEARLAAVVRQANDGLAEQSERLAEIERQTVDLTGAARDLGFTFASALEDAIVEGQGLSEMLRGLEKDILRVMARTLITEPLATGIQDALRDVFPEAAGTGEGGLGGLVRSGLGGLFGLLRPEGAPESTTPPFVGSDRAGDFGGYFGEDPGDTAKSVAQVAGLGDASGATGEVLLSVLSEGARMAGFEAVSQATAATAAAVALAELTVAATVAAAAMQAVAASSAAGGGGGEMAALAAVFGPGPHAASGGLIHGPGGPRGDRIPAMLSDGEFVVNARATRRHRGLLEMVNAGAELPAFASGGGLTALQRFAIMTPRPSPPGAEAAARDELLIAERPIVVNINNPSNVPQIQHSMSQIRGSLRRMLAEAERRNE